MVRQAPCRVGCPPAADDPPTTTTHKKHRGAQGSKPDELDAKNLHQKNGKQPPKDPKFRRQVVPPHFVLSGTTRPVCMCAYLQTCGTAPPHALFLSSRAPPLPQRSAQRHSRRASTSSSQDVVSCVAKWSRYFFSERQLGACMYVQQGTYGGSTCSCGTSYIVYIRSHRACQTGVYIM